MKVVVGIDLGRSFRPCLELLERLRFPSLEVTLVNAIEPILPDGAFPELASSSPLVQILADLRRAGEEALAEASAHLTALGHRVKTEIDLGSAAGNIMATAKDEQADLVAAGAATRSAVESFFTGNVAKSLATECRSSVLIGKHEPVSQDGLKIVFAHDLSDYAERALERFVAMAPMGVREAVLVTADTTDPSIVAVAERLRPDMAGETLDIIHSRLAKTQQRSVDKLRSLGCEVDSVVSEGSPERVVHEVAEDTQADLVVLGSQGHGFLDRVLVGSFALHQVVREPHNVLLVRA